LQTQENVAKELLWSCKLFVKVIAGADAASTGEQAGLMRATE
jgi:hypothetical protein